MKFDKERSQTGVYCTAENATLHAPGSFAAQERLLRITIKAWIRRLQCEGC